MITWQMRSVHPPQQLQEFDLARRRQRQFRLVEDEDALALAALLEEAQKALAMRVREEIGRRAADGDLRAPRRDSARPRRSSRRGRTSRW